MKFLFVPMLDHSLFAGRPVDLGDARIVGYRWLPKPVGATPQDQYLVATVTGDSLRDARIADGDWVMFRVNSQAQPGQLCVIATPDGLTVKFFHPQPDGTVRLRSAHPQHPDRQWEATDIKIRGVVVASGQDWA